MSKYYTTSLWLTGAYFLTGWLGLMMPAVGTAVTLLWLPTGIAVAVLYRSGYRHWPAVTIGAILVNLVFGQSLALAVGISIGNTLGPMLSVWLLQQLRFDARFERNRDIAILAAAGHAGMAISASGGVAVLFLSGLPRHEVFNVWMYWWAGDSMGVIAAAPLLLVANRLAVRSIRIRYREFAGWLLLLFLITGCVFVLNRRFTNPALPFAFVPLAVIPWGTMRFGTMGTSLAIILISFVAVYGTSSQSGPFSRADASDQILLLWIYMATTATLGWSVAALQLAQARATSFQLILEKALSEVSLGVLMTDNSQNVTYMNTGFTSLTGYEESDLLRKNCRILQGKETDRSVVAKVKSEISKNGHFDGEILNYRKDGTPFWNALLITEIHNDAGEQIGFLGIQRDVTAKKDAELALRQSEVHLRSILDLEPDCVKVVSPSGRLMEMNAAGLAMIEAGSIEQVRGAKLEDLIVEEHRVLFRRMHQQVLAGDAGRLEFAISGLKGTHRWLESRCVPYRSTDGKITGLLGVTRDVTTRRQVEVTMRESRNRLNSILNSISEVVYSASVSGDGILFMSDHAMTLYGRTAIDFIAVPNLRFSVIHADDQNAVNECLQTLNETGEYDAEYRIIRPDGGQRWVRDRGQFMRDDAGIPIRLDGVISDITDRRERQTQAANERLVLELLASGAPLDDVLHQVALNSEQLCWGMLCSIMILDESGERLRHAAAPGLPVDYCRAIDGIRIGLNAGSCGTSAFTGKSVFVTDIATDPRWVNHRDAALKHGLRACWSVPMISAANKVLGTLAMYYSETRTPDAQEMTALQRTAYLAVLAVERHQLISSLRDSRQRIETLVSNLPGMAYRCQNDADWTMIYVSAGSEMITGYRPEELIEPADLSYASLVYSDDREWLKAKRRSSIEAGTECRNVYRIVGKAGQVRWVLDCASGVVTDDDPIKYIDGFMQDITESRGIEEQVRASLREKEAMLKEIHHRVKNNLQIVSSLLNLQIERVSDSLTLDALRESQNRVRSMALVHETLYRSGNLGRIDLTEYMHALCSHLFRSFGVDPSIIHLTLNVVNTSLDLERAIPLGLITNELVSNALKYAFPAGRSGVIRVDFEITAEDSYKLVVADDGIGLPESFDLNQLRSLGLQLTRDLVQQLSGSLTIVHAPGTTFHVSFPLFPAEN